MKAASVSRLIQKTAKKTRLYEISVHWRVQKASQTLARRVNLRHAGESGRGMKREMTIR